MKNDIFFHPDKTFNKDDLKNAIKHKKHITSIKRVSYSLLFFIILAATPFYTINKNTGATLEIEIALYENSDYNNYYETILDNDEEFWDLNE